MLYSGSAARSVAAVSFNMIKFFKFHPRLEVYEHGTHRSGDKAVVAAVPDGLLHGHLLGAEVINMNTCISEAMLQGTERALWQRLLDGHGPQWPI